MLHIPCLKWALSTGIFALIFCIFVTGWGGKGREGGVVVLQFLLLKHAVGVNESTEFVILVILQEWTSPSVPVSSERVSQHRHSDEERAGPMWAATEATYILSGTQHNSKEHIWAWHTYLQEPFVEVNEMFNIFCALFFVCFLEQL